MSPPWSKPLDIDRLADAEADVEFAIPLGELPGLRSHLPGLAGAVGGHVRFTREPGFVIADLDVSGSAQLECQRCLEPMIEPVRSSARVALIASEADASRVPDHLEPVLAAGGRISIAQLVEEELLLALPIVPLHARTAECAPAASAAPADSSRAEATQRPFERLGELLKR